MHYSFLATILACTVATAGASPIVDPELANSLVDSRHDSLADLLNDHTSPNNAKKKQHARKPQGTPPVAPPPVIIGTDANGSPIYATPAPTTFFVSSIPSVTLHTSTIPAATQIDEWPHNGWYTGTAGQGCGDLLGPDKPNAPTETDCQSALTQWTADDDWKGRHGRQTQVFGTCVLAWYPIDTSIGWTVTGAALQAQYNLLLQNCLTGPNLDLVSNYAYETASTLGTFSIYFIDSPPDGPQVGARDLKRSPSDPEADSRKANLARAAQGEVVATPTASTTATTTANPGETPPLTTTGTTTVGETSTTTTTTISTTLTTAESGPAPTSTTVIPTSTTEPWPHAGKYTGTDGKSCGNVLAPGSDDAPLVADCEGAVAKWGDNKKKWNAKWRRQTQVNGTCVVAWYPDLWILSATGDDLHSNYVTLGNSCLAGPNQEYISNYAYETIYLGTLSMYKTGDEPDGPPSLSGRSHDDLVAGSEKEHHARDAPVAHEVDATHASTPTSTPLTSGPIGKRQQTAVNGYWTTDENGNPYIHSVTTYSTLSVIPPTPTSTAPAPPATPANKWPYIGKYTGTEPDSCGDAPVGDGSAGPTKADCISAMGQWLWDENYLGRFGRQTQVYNTCVLAWYPASQDLGWEKAGSDLTPHFQELMDGCLTVNGVYVTNYAHIMIADVGTFSVYNAASPPDGPPPPSAAGAY